jgi:uncharacterized protein
MVTYQDIERMTRDDGEGWGFSHACRVLALSEIIGVELTYDREAFSYAVMLHDWGAFPRHRQPGIDHALRSRQIAEDSILPQTVLSPMQRLLAAEAIELHDYRDARPVTTTEALLLREADFLDFLGVIGFAREFAWGPNDLQRCYDRLIARRDALRNRFTLSKAKVLAEQRLAEMQEALDLLLADAMGHL